MSKWLDRMDKYKKIILPILDEQDVPQEIFYLAMIESGLNPMAYSYAHASGLWQFISSTGKIYGLNNNFFKLIPISSTITFPQYSLPGDRMCPGFFPVKVIVSFLFSFATFFSWWGGSFFIN